MARMTKKILVVLVWGVWVLAAALRADVLTSVPGPDDQGEMIMPMVRLEATAGGGSNPTAGVLHITFSPAITPVLKPLTEWMPGGWFAEAASWRPDLSPISGSVLGMPDANAGNGSLFNNQYGFTFMANGMPGMAYVPTGCSLAIRLDSISSSDMKSFNYGQAANRWDQVFDGVNSQVLWSGSMWHNYFTLPNLASGNYSATFEVFIADTPFTGVTGFAQYDAAALSAGRNGNFTSAFVTYQFSAVPEPSASALLVFVGVGLVLFVARRRPQVGLGGSFGSGGFTLPELLVGMAVLGTLSALVAPGVQRAVSQSRGVGCVAKVRALGAATALFCHDHAGEFPRSFHSAGAHRQPGWAVSVFPYLGGGPDAQDDAGFQRFLRCPAHQESNLHIYSYAMNVHFELDPEGDDYAGSPQTWRRMSQLPAPSRVVLFVEARPSLYGDHVMCHQWSSPVAAKNAMSQNRHSGKSNMVFADGHVETLRPEDTLNPSRNINLWNPSLAM